MAETALVVVFPELEALLGHLRRAHTPSGAHDLPAHATLIYPFMDSVVVDEHTPAIARTFRPFAPFEARFRQTGRWPETLYLRPEPAEPFVELTEALVEAFPAYPPYGGRFEEIVPHVTIATGADSVLRQVEARLASIDVTLRVERVWLFEHDAGGWRRRTSFPLDRHAGV